MKTTREPKKTALLKRASVNKVISKKAVSTKKSVLKKLVGSKKFKNIHPMGIFAAIGGALGLFILINLFVSINFTQISSTDLQVLGITSELSAPEGLSIKNDNYAAKLSWTYNAPSSDYNYKIFYYNTKYQAFLPGIGVNLDPNISLGLKYGFVTFDGVTVTAKIDQTPGQKVIYKVALCYKDCRIDYKRDANGVLISMADWTAVDPVGELSSSASITIPKITTPNGLKTSIINKSIKLNWNSITGVDGYNIWRSDGIFSEYKKVGSVGIPGTFSTWHTLNGDGTLGIPINVPSPTSFTDRTANKGKTYFYKVSATKMISPITYSKGWLNIESSRSIFKYARIR